jgi:hypothetical protein
MRAHFHTRIHIHMHMHICAHIRMTHADTHEHIRGRHVHNMVVRRHACPASQRDRKGAFL